MRLAAAVLVIGVGVGAASADWLEWGGEGRDFTIEAQTLEGWGSEGPKEIWRRELGDGYSAILAEGGALYTMYRSGTDREALIKLDAKTGETQWEYEQSAPVWDGLNTRFGPGPHATPVIRGDHIYGAGVRGDVFALDKNTGKRLWLRKTWDEFGTEPPGRGYASSPMVYENTLIVAVGGRGQALVALDLDTGKTVWSSGNYKNAYASPILITVDGQDQIVMFVQGHIVGFEAATGEELWSHAHSTKYEINAATPVWGADNLLFLSSAYDKGGQVIRLSQQQGKTTVEPLWFERKFQVHHGSAVRLGNTIHGSHGDFGPAFLTSADVETGKILSRQRGFGKSNLIAVGQKILLLDDDGTLALTRTVSDSLQVESSAQIFDARTWTAPTLVGTRLYARDQKEIVALDLSE